MANEPTNVADVQDLVQKFWAETFVPELVQSNPLVALVNKNYEGEIKEGGDEVTVSQIVKVAAQRKTIGTEGDNAFETDKLVTRSIKVKADQIITGAVEINSLASLQSQLERKESDIRKALLTGVIENLNAYLYSLVSPSTTTPDHVLNSIANMDRSQLIAMRTLASSAKWASGERYALLSPEYYGTMLADTSLTSADHVDDRVIVGGQPVVKRLGFNILEDDSRDGKKGLFFHPDFMHLVTQMQPTFKLSDLHSQQKLGYLLSVHMVCGAKLGIQGELKHATATSASGT